MHRLRTTLAFSLAGIALTAALAIALTVRDYARSRDIPIRVYIPAERMAALKKAADVRNFMLRGQGIAARRAVFPALPPGNIYDLMLDGDGPHSVMEPSDSWKRN